MKCEATQELVVGGFTDPQGSRVGLGALLVGYFDRDDLVFAGKIGTGFDTKLLLDLRTRLDALEIPASPFTKAIGLPRVRAHWVRPEDRRAGRLHRVDGTRQASPSPPAARPHRQGRARGRARDAVITHPEKVLFPDDGITKGELAAYYEAIAPVMLPHIRARPVTMERYPAGIGRKGFMHKDVSKGFPEWLERVEVPKKDGIGPPSARDRHAIAAVAGQPEHDHTARLELARASTSFSPISASSISTRPSTSRMSCERSSLRFAISWTIWACRAG